VTLADLGNRAVIEHDLNVYRVLVALGRAAPLGQGDRARLDFGMLAIPPIDPEPHTRRLANLDIQTALCLMNIPFAACLTPAEYRRAVHSLRLDTSLLRVRLRPPLPAARCPHAGVSGRGRPLPATTSRGLKLSSRR